MKSPKTIMNCTASRPALGAMSAVERRLGRYMRAPDGHGDAAPVADAPADPAPVEPAADPAPAPVDAGDDDASPLGGKPDDAPAGDEPAKDGGDEAPQPRPGAPEKYELTVPADLAEKGVQFDAEAFGEVEPLLREMGLSNDEAQKLVDTYAGKIMPLATQRAEAAMLDHAKAQRKEWSEAFEADEQIGGANREATLSAAARAFDFLGMKRGEGLRQLLDETGLGFHPEMIGAWAKVGNMLVEGSFERGDTPSAPKAPEQKMYGAEFQPKS